MRPTLGSEGSVRELKLSPESLVRHLEQQLLPVYLISGDEPLLTGEAADAVRVRARSVGFSEREVHFLDRGMDWDAVRGAVHTLSLFAQRRIIELRLPSGKPGTVGGRVLAGLIESLGTDVVLLILTGRLDRDAQSADWVRAVEARGAWVQAWPIPLARMRPWLEARCRRLGIAVDAQGLRLLVERTEGNLLAAHQELQKLELLHPRERIDAERVLAATADNARFNLSELTEALLSEQAPRALRVLEGLRAEGVELPLILWAVVKALHQAWSRYADAPRQETRFARLVARALDADGKAKGRLSGDAWDELALLVADMCGREALSAA
ncbi:MAG TPA: DNA polymerase III subunit delta [Steroidobacteraceae bacterium]|nr:DNA polymerase III subunit delta [Steroidobacteraceae bacterium]